MALEYILYADESVADGEYFSNFYGGCIVESKHLREVERVLNAKKQALNLYREVKWQKVTATYLGKYEELMGTFFELVRAGQIKVRVMFTQNRNVPSRLTSEQRENAYFLLYYQFVKHAFGLGHAEHGQPLARIRVYLDALPDSFEKRARFRAFLAALTKSPEFRAARVVIDEQQIAEVDSHDHVLLQCTDIALGAMQFRLNNMHKRMPAGAKQRGSRTIAKEKLYKAILGHIRGLHPHFNIGITTGIRGDRANRWRDPYRHWKFVPREHEVDDSKSKPKER
jgi:hypothetical protein